MPSYGITPTGFNTKRLDLLLEELNAEMKAIFGDNLNLSPESPDGQVNGVISESNANLWELAEKAYNSFNPSAASGATLSDLVQLNNITRQPATPSTVELTMTGTPGTIIPVGSLVSTVDSSVEFATDAEVTIPGGGSITVNATATETGPLSAVAGTVTEIDTPISGWATVNNAADATEGTNEETDPELRARRSRSVSRSSQAIIEAIRANIAAIENVTQVSILENDTDSVDGNGQPAHSFQAVVVGGADQSIVDTIWQTKPIGIEAFGNVNGTATDSEGIVHDIDFSRPTEIDIYVTVTLVKNSDYPADGDTLMKQAIVDYALGLLVPDEGFELADDVIYSRLYTPINSIPGHQVSDLEIGTTPSPTGKINIVIGDVEISNFDVANIVIVS